MVMVLCEEAPKLDLNRLARSRGGLLGLLIGDACGVPYEFTDARMLPPLDQLEMRPPAGFIRSYADVPVGSWSDDGAQALCLMASLLKCGCYHPYDFASRLLRWFDVGYMAVNRYVFDVGNQTSVSIQRLKRGQTIDYSGLAGVRNNGNGSLMRSLPLALLHTGNDYSLVMDAHRQSRLTHSHLRSQLCCGLYCLWVRYELRGFSDAWERAVESVRRIHSDSKSCMYELDTHILIDTTPRGTGYVVDSLHSALYACEADSYEAIVKRAISLGNDTDTTACIAGGIAGVRYGEVGIPDRWMTDLCGWDWLGAVIDRLQEELQMQEERWSRLRG